MKNLVIKIQQLKTFLSEVKKWTKSYFDSRVMTFQTRADYEAAVARGEVAEGTIINIIEDYEPWVECSDEDIEAMFK